MGQVLTLLKAKLAAKDDLLGFVANPPPVINCANGDFGSIQTGPLNFDVTGQNRICGTVWMSRMTQTRGVRNTTGPFERFSAGPMIPKRSFDTGTN